MHFGAETGTRTQNLLITSQLRYQLRHPSKVVRGLYQTVPLFSVSDSRTLTRSVVYTPLLEEFHRDTVSRVYFSSGTPFASEWCVRHIRDYDLLFLFFLSSTPHLGGVEPPDSFFKREKVLYYHFGLVDSHQKHVLRVTGGEIRSRSALLCGLFQTGQGQMPLDVVNIYVRPYINNIYSAKFLMHSPLLTDAGPRICSCGFFRNTFSYAIRASSTVILASADVASF